MRRVVSLMVECQLNVDRCGFESLTTYKKTYMDEYFTYINNRLCVAARWLYSNELGGVMTRSKYDKLNSRGRIEVVVQGKGQGNIAQVAYESLSPDDRKLIESKLGCHPREIIKDSMLKGYIQADNEAIKFFAEYSYGEQGYEKTLPADVQYEYYANVQVLNAMKLVIMKKRQTAANISGKLKNPWPALVESVKELGQLKTADGRRIYPHTLSDNERVLERQHKKYIAEGYAGLIHKNFGSQNAKKVTDLVEALLLSIHALPSKPYMTSLRGETNSVHGIYLQFLGGGLDLVNVKTGEMFNRDDFFTPKGQPVELSGSTVQNYLKKLENSNALEKVRNSELYWNSKHRPIHHRHAAQFSLSKLTMDDIAIPFKKPDGQRVWAYQVYDTMSTCVVGRAYARDKGVDMLIDSLKDMMKLCLRNDWGFPAEIECEQHLANTLTGTEHVDGTFEEDLLTAGTLFPFVSFQRGGMPQGKRAEGFIKQKKYTQQAKRAGFQRRPFALLEANRLNTDKNNIRYTMKEIMANEETDINNYNNALHPDQVRFEGKTRWQVLIENINPDLPRHPMPVLAFHLGECNEEAAIHRSQWVTVKGKKFALPTPEIIKRLKSLTVQAYYLDPKDINEVYIYQNGRYICTCKGIETYNEAKVERTEADDIAALQFNKAQAQFDKMTKDTRKRIVKLELLNVVQLADELEKQPEGMSPIHGEFDEPDLDTQKQEAKEFRKLEKQRVKVNANTKDAFFDLINNSVDFGD